MGNFDSQLAAAQRQYESLSPDDDCDEALTQDAIARVSASLIESGDVEELVAELYAVGDELLSMLSKQRLVSTSAADFMRRLRRLDTSVYCAMEAIERENAAESEEARAEYWEER